MDRATQSEAYKGFFGSDSGKAFLAELDYLINNAHAESDSSDDPMVVFGYSKEARGITKIKEHITVMMTDLKK